MLCIKFAWVLAILGFIGFQAIEASTTSRVFARYPNKYFVETGSCRGDGIQAALDAGFKQIYSVELGAQLFKHCSKRFSGFPNVHLHHGNSIRLLPLILKQIDAPATIWLDAHYSWGETVRGKTNTPVLDELECIRQHPIKTHTILIDDVRQFGTIEFDFIELEEIVQKILEINPKYTISYEDGQIKNDVLVARIR